MAESDRSRRSGARRVYGWLLQACILLIVLFSIHLWQTRNVASGPAPPLLGRTLQGDPFDLAAAEGPILVHFWATWCPVCRLELGNIDALHPEYGVITVAMMSGSDGEILQYLRDKEVDFPVISDPGGHIASSWGVTAVPASFVLDGQGNIRFTEVGYSTSRGLRARLWLAQ